MIAVSKEREDWSGQEEGRNSGVLPRYRPSHAVCSVKVCISFALASAVNLFAPVVFGQNAGPVPLRLTLKDAVELGLKQNIDLQVANINTAVSQQQQRISRSALLPQATLEATEQIQRYNLQALIGLQIAGVPKNIGPFQDLRLGPRFSVPVFDLTLLRSYQASGHRVQASKEDLTSAREQTVLLTVSEYFAGLRADADVKAARSRVQLAEDLARQAEALRASGVATRIDTSRSEVRVLTEKQGLVDAQLEVQTTLLALKRILALPDNQPVELADSAAFSQTSSLDIADPVVTALRDRPELRSLSDQEMAAMDDRKAAVANRLPRMTFTGGWNEQGRRPEGIFPGYDFELNFSVPLWSGGRLTAEQQAAALAERKLQKQLQDARDRVAEQVHDGENELKAARSNVELGRERVRLAEEEVNLAQGRFAAGVTDNIEVTTAQDELARANDVAIGALYRYNVSRANLARAIGAIERIYVRP
jgi:outer membrane protein